MKSTRTLIFDREKFALHDGPGIRTVVFMKGCPLRCLWCHNPESQSFKAELLFNSSRCRMCGKCAAVCKGDCHAIEEGKHSFDREKCLQCGLCTTYCPGDALKLCGREMSVDEVMEEVLKDKVFYETSGGGITLSGGEPLAHIDFTAELLQAAKANLLHTAVETCGFAPWEHIEQLLDSTDLWLYDIKAEAGKHKALTGVPFEPIAENLRKLSDSGASIILRCPLVPGTNDTNEHLTAIGKLADSLKGVEQIDLEPYHPLGESKALQLGRNDVFHSGFPAEADKKRWLELVGRHTSVKINRGNFKTPQNCQSALASI